MRQSGCTFSEGTKTTKKIPGACPDGKQTIAARSKNVWFLGQCHHCIQDPVHGKICLVQLETGHRLAYQRSPAKGRSQRPVRRSWTPSFQGQLPSSLCGNGPLFRRRLLSNGWRGRYRKSHGEYL